MAHQILWKSLVALFVVLSLCRPTLQVPEVTCSHGLTPTQMADYEDLDLRLGETLYLVCEKDSSPTANYSSLLIHQPRYDGRNCVYNSQLSNAPLRYVWHCEIHSSNSIKIYGIRSDNGNVNDDPVLNLNIRVHDLRSSVPATDVTQTTPPSEGATQATTTSNLNAEDADPQMNHFPDDVTTRAPETSVPENAEKTLGLQIAVVILAAMVLLLVLLVVIMAAKLYRTRGEKSTDQRAEEGALTPKLSFTTCSRDSEEQEGGGAATINQERPETAVAESERTTTSDTTERTVQERTDERVTGLDSSSDSTSVLDTSTEPMLKQTPQS